MHHYQLEVEMLQTQYTIRGDLGLGGAHIRGSPLCHHQVSP